MNHIALIFLLLAVLALGLFLWARSRVRRSCNCGCDHESGAQPQATPEVEPARKSEHFLIKPYLQLGTKYDASQEGTLEIVWHAQDEEKTFWTAVVRSQINLSKGFKVTLARAPLTTTSIPALATVPAHNQHKALVTGRTPGEQFSYDLYRNGKVVFSASTTAPKAGGVPHRFIAVGDIAEGRPGQAKVAYQMSQYKADLVVVPGDVAYKRGLFSENLEKFFPVMNNDEAAPDKGAPLMRSTPFVSIPGNHDYGCPDIADVPNLDEHPDLFAWFYLWSQPLNGPDVGKCETNVQRLTGAQARKDAFLQAADGRYPRMANFSFDYGDVHWLFLDANPHMDWTCPELRAWVRNDLTAAKATWKFVVYHQPSFTSHSRHRVEERMRLLADIFQECGVDIAWTGHAHWYERDFPLKFAVKPQADGRLISATGAVDGDFTLDKAFDGVLKTRPEGVIYIVTGGGGAKLQAVDLPREGWRSFTHKLISDRHSFTVVDVDAGKVTVRQISEDGEELDRFVVTK